MTANTWDFFMPDTAIEKSELEQAIDAIEQVINKSCPIQCVQEYHSGNLAEFALSLAIEADDPETLMACVARQFIRTGEELLRAHGFTEGVKQGKHLAALKRAS